MYAAEHGWPPVEQPKRRRTWPWVLIGLVVLLVLGCAGLGAIIAGGGPSNNGIDGEPSGKLSRHVAGSGPVAKPKPKAKAKAKTIGEGLWLVGEDVPAGRYKTSGARDESIPLCYWHVAKDDTDNTILVQGLNDKPGEQGRVTLKSGQYFKTSGCADWVKQ